MKLLISSSVALLLYLLSAKLVGAVAYQISTPFAGFQKGATPDIAQYVSGLYTYALGIVGVVALGAIIFWGVAYTLAAGNASKKQDAIDGITQAIYGVLLLLGAYLILYTINPALVSLRAPGTRELFNIPTVSPPQTTEQRTGGERARSDYLGRNLSQSEVERARAACEGAGGIFTEFTDVSGKYYSCQNIQ